MDGARFDALAKTLVAATNRRRTLGGLVAGTLALLGLADPEEAWSAKSGKCKPKCDNCERCKKGKCRTNNQGKKVCKKGKCKPKKGLVNCASTGQVRNEVTCGCCTVPGGSCDPQGENVDCCSGFCGFPGVCAGLPSGRSCSFDAQCQSDACNNGSCA